ncbi:hypothetical protein QWY89_07585 [Mucilaginibacter myungsuensis]|nr:hypothetical protein [Mucilaginibacter myungsuensis]MDN3598506.1 hypothetical protein [Mucilaginibacter myungsuensis]
MLSQTLQTEHTPDRSQEGKRDFKALLRICHGEERRVGFERWSDAAIS